MTTNRPLTDEEIAAIAERCRRASPGPWQWCDESESSLGLTDPYGLNPSRMVWLGADGECADRDESVFAPGTVLDLPSGPDADFICNARTDIPRLLQEVVLLKAEIRSLRNRLGGQP